LTYGTSNGTLALYVVNDLSSPDSTLPVNVTGVVYVAAVSDYRLQFYEGVGMWAQRVVVTRTPEALDSQSGDVWQDFQKPFSPIAPSVGFSEEGLINPERNKSIVDLCKRMEPITNTPDITAPFSSTWNFSSGGSSNGYVYFCSVFIWARGSFRLQRIASGSNTCFASVYGLELANNSGFPYARSTQAVQVGIDWYPCIPMPYWPVAAALMNPDSTTSYFPLIERVPSGSEWSTTWSITQTNGFLYAAVGDDFGLYGLYCPPSWFQADPLSDSPAPAVVSRKIGSRQAMTNWASFPQTTKPVSLPEVLSEEAVPPRKGKDKKKL
jgi:hypothetical protein